LHLALRVDCPDPTGNDFNLWFSKLSLNRVQLPVDVADAHIIQIHQSQLANAGSDERLDRPGANAPDPDHAHMSSSERPKSIDSEQAPDAAESGFGLIRFVCEAAL